MHKAKRIFKRIFFCFVSVVLVCCMLFNMATPKAQAVAIVDDLAIGITALLLLAAAGVVFAPKVSEDIVAIGQSFKTSMYQWGTSAEKLDEVEEWFSDLTLYNPCDPGDEGDEDPRYQVRLARGILAGIAGWIASVCFALHIKNEQPLPEGSVSYAGVVLPPLPYSQYSSYGKWLIVSLDGLFYAVGTNGMFNINAAMTTFGAETKTGQSRASFTSLVCDGSSWNYSFSASNFMSSTVRFTSSSSLFDDFIWTNEDILANSNVVFAGSDVSSVSTTTIPSDSVLSDLPGQIQSGEKDADDIILPGLIDYGSLIHDGMTLEESVIDTMSQLSDGTLSHQAYLDKTMVAEMPTFTQNLPVTDDMSFIYSVGEQADTFTVAASGNVDGSGTLTYEWLDTSTVPYTVLGTGQSYTPDTSHVADYSLACRVTNTVPCSFVETGYVTNVAYSWTYHITVSDTVVDPPGSDTETDEDEKLGIISGTLDRIESLLNPDTDTLTDSSQALQGSMNELGTFEQSQLDGLQNNKHVITDAFKIFGEGSTLLSAFNLVTYIVNGTYNSLGMYQVVITLPVVLGIFLFICSRVRGFDRPRKNNPGSRSSQVKVSAAAGGNDPKSPEV